MIQLNIGKWMRETLKMIRLFVFISCIKATSKNFSAHMLHWSKIIFKRSCMLQKFISMNAMQSLRLYWMFEISIWNFLGLKENSFSNLSRNCLCSEKNCTLCIHVLDLFIQHGIFSHKNSYLWRKDGCLQNSYVQLLIFSRHQNTASKTRFEYLFTH